MEPEKKRRKIQEEGGEHGEIEGYLGSFQDSNRKNHNEKAISHRYAVQWDFEPGEEVVIYGLLIDGILSQRRFQNRVIRIRLFENTLTQEETTGGPLTRIENNFSRVVDTGFWDYLDDALDDLIQKVSNIMYEYSNQEDSFHFHISEVVVTIIESNFTKGRRKLRSNNRCKQESTYCLKESEDYIFVDLIHGTSFVNCFFIALNICLNWKKHREYFYGNDFVLQRSGYALKERLKKVLKPKNEWNNIWDKGAVDISDITQILNEKRFVLKVYDETMSLSKVYEPTTNFSDEELSKFPINIVKMQINRGHIVAMISKEAIKHRWKDFVYFDEANQTLDDLKLYKVVTVWKQKGQKVIKNIVYSVRPVFLDEQGRIWYKTRIFEDEEAFKNDMIEEEDELKIKQTINFNIQSPVQKKTQLKKKPDNMMMIRKDNKKNKTGLDWKIGTLDFETFPIMENSPLGPKGIHKIYAAGFAWNKKPNNDDNLSDKEYIDFYGLDSAKMFMDFLYTNRKNFNRYTIYWHNGGKFDCQLLLREYLLKNDSKWFIPFTNHKERFSIIYSNGRFMNVIIKAAGSGETINFKDSFCLKPSSLSEFGKGFGVPKEYQKGDLEHSKYNELTFNDNKMKDECLKYLKCDAMGLLIAVENMNHKFYFDPKIGINITECVSAASAAIKTWKNNFYHPIKGLEQKYGTCFGNDRYPFVFKLHREDDEFVRNSYYGGRTESFFIGQIPEKKFYMYDVCSEYPTVGKNYLPCGKPRILDHEQIKKLYWVKRNNQINFCPWLPGSFFGWVRCVVKDREPENFNRYRLLGLKVNQKLYFPIFDEWTDITLFSGEIYTAMKSKLYDFDFTKAKFVEFCRGKILEEYFDSMFQNKDEADREAKNAKDEETKKGAITRKELYKIELNSVYGKFGMKLLRNSIEITKADQSSILHYMTDTKRLLDFHMVEEELYDLFHIETLVENSEISVPVAAAITSYARCYLWNIFDTIYSHGGKVYYCDTDSVITNLDLREISKKDSTFREIYFNTSKKMGNLENEAKTTGYFNNGIISGLKMYYIGYKDEKGETVEEKGKCKGFKRDIQSKEFKDPKEINEGRYRASEINEKSMKLLDEGNTLVNKQLQMKCGTTGIVHKESSIDHTELTKEIKKCYEKGKVLQDGFIRPWTISEIKQDLPKIQMLNYRKYGNPFGSIDDDMNIVSILTNLNKQ